MQDHLVSTSSLTLVLNTETAGHPNLWQYATETQIPSFVSICATLIRAVAADALLLGSKNFHLFILTGGSFFFQCQRVQTHESKQNPRAWPHLTNWHANQWSASAASPRLRTTRFATWLWWRKAWATSRWSGQSYFAMRYGATVRKQPWCLKEGCGATKTGSGQLVKMVEKNLVARSVSVTTYRNTVFRLICVMWALRVLVSAW